MKRLNGLAAAGLMLIGATLGGCAGTDVATLTAEIAQIRAQTQAVCSFVPTVASVANLIGSFIPNSSTPISVASQIASAVCSAAAKSGARRNASSARVLVQGIPVDGDFVIPK